MNEIKTTVNPVGVADYEERKQAKIDRLHERAQKAREQGAQLQAEFIGNDDIAYWTQPIHNTSAGRAFERQRERVRNRFEKGMEVIQTATAYEDRAEAMATNHAISSDDPEAIAKLQAKIDELEKAHARKKAANSALRLKNAEKGNAKLAELGYTEKQIQALRNGGGFASWSLSSDNAEIKRCRERIEEIQSRAELVGWSFVGGEVVANKSEDRYQVIFDDIPDDETRTALKKSGFRWSRNNGAWQRMLNKNTLREMRYYLPFLRPVEIVEMLDGLKTEKPENLADYFTEKNTSGMNIYHLHAYYNDFPLDFVVVAPDAETVENFLNENNFRVVSGLYPESRFDSAVNALEKSAVLIDLTATAPEDQTTPEPTTQEEESTTIKIVLPETSEPEKTIFNVHYIKDTAHYAELAKAFSENDIQKYYDSMNADVIIISAMEENDVPTACKVLDIPPAETVAEPDNTPEPEPTPNEAPIENNTALISVVRGLLAHLFLIPLNDCYILPDLDSTDNTPTKALKALLDEIADSEEEEDGGEWVKPVQPCECPTEAPTAEPHTEHIEPPETAVQPSVNPEEMKEPTQKVLTIYADEDKAKSKMVVNFFDCFYGLPVEDVRKFAKMAEFSDKTHGTNNIEIMEAITNYVLLTCKIFRSVSVENAEHATGGTLKMYEKEIKAQDRYIKKCESVLHILEKYMNPKTSKRAVNTAVSVPDTAEGKPETVKPVLFQVGERYKGGKQPITILGINGNKIKFGWDALNGGCRYATIMTEENGNQFFWVCKTKIEAVNVWEETAVNAVSTGSGKPVDPVKRFETGKVYGTTLLTSSDCLITFKVAKRSKCFVWLEDRQGEIEKRKIRVHEWYTANNTKIQAESCDPLGQYSMSPILDATDELEYATPKEARDEFDRERVKREKRIRATVGNITISVDNRSDEIPQF